MKTATNGKETKTKLTQQDKVQLAEELSRLADPVITVHYESTSYAVGEHGIVDHSSAGHIFGVNVRLEGQLGLGFLAVSSDGVSIAPAPSFSYIVFTNVLFLFRNLDVNKRGPESTMPAA